MWRIGQRVQCINGRFSPLVWEFANQVPVEGCVYTVRGVGMDNLNLLTGARECGIHLEEVVNAAVEGWQEAFFSAWRFREASEESEAEREQQCELVLAVGRPEW